MWLLALDAMAGGDGAGARAHLASLGERERRTVVPLFPYDVTDEVHLVRIARAAGDDELACSAVATAMARWRRNPDVVSIAGAALHARALAADDRVAIAEAVERLARGPRPLALASALEDAGRLAAGCGERHEAVARFGRALEVYAAAGAARDAARIRRRLRSLGVRRRLVSARRLRPEAGWSALTPSEMAVVRLIAQGRTNREAADRLFLSPHTVSTHLRHAFAKLDVRSRVELARLASQHEAAQDPPARS
jgi:DNA-binding CsgD family transcriptional regulator